MSHLHCISKRKKGTHLGYSDRQILEWAYNQNLSRSKKARLSQRRLAEKLDMSTATLSRELKRGLVRQLDSELREYWTYSAEVAQQDYDYRASRKGPGFKIGHDHELASHIARRLLGIREDGSKTRGYSPDAVIMELEQMGWPYKTKLSTRTLYSYIEKDVFYGVTLKDLPRGQKNKKRRKRRVRRSNKVPTGRQIEDRPKTAEDRLEAGHWEMDCIESVKGDPSCILSLVDRYTREAFLFKLSSQTQRSVQRALNGLERQLGAKHFRERFKSITVDNGSEFWDWEGLETSVLTKQERTQIYYAHPYSSWERGSNENLNGFVRYSIPKKTRISDYTKKKIQELQDWINHYPRRILGGKTAAQFSWEA
ncbi:MAG: IS30 family transposase [Saccharofermentanales bacterium]|jgi:IS30 family transposase